MGQDGGIDVAASRKLPGRVLAGLTLVLWAAVAWLATRFLAEDFAWSYVAEQTYRGAPWPYRLAAVWGGMEGSLLLFTTVVATALAVATRRANEIVTAAAVATVVALGGILLVLASPFGRLSGPEVDGFGMNPILEHPAMAIHPPLLYVGLALAGGAAARAVADGVRAARPWLLACAGVLAAAMTLGSAWSYMEQGWGGYWAWDPVENTSLVVWLAVLVALHLPPATAPRWGRAVTIVPWVLVLVGSSIVRSGRTPSVHGFAEQLAVGWSLAAVAVVTIVAAVVEGRRARRDAPPRGVGRSAVPLVADPRPVAIAVIAASTVIVAIGAVAPIVIDVVGDRDSAIDGSFYSRLIGPVALVAIPFVATQVAGARRSPRSRVAHAAMLALVVGIGLSTFDRVATVPIEAGDTEHAAGVEVVNVDLKTGPGDRPLSERVDATVRVDGHVMRPGIVAYPERGGRLAEVAVRPGLWTDTHAVLERADDSGAVVVTIHRRHGMALVWAAMIILTVTLVWPVKRRRLGDAAMSLR